MIEQHVSLDDVAVVTLNGMLRGELAAVETYNRAIANVRDVAMIADLERIRDEHQSAVCALRHWVRDVRKMPVPNSGAWGFFAAALTGIAAIIGDAALLTALKRGERHGESTYRQELGNPDLPDGFRFLLGSQLLPRCQEHLGRLERLSKLTMPADRN